MCGIAGYFGRKSIDDCRVNQTLELMKRRGPNGQKCKKISAGESKSCYFLHSRLSIIDLDHRSDQPFHYNGKTIIFNGEIYNYIEVKKDLEKLGHKFITKSDTEVLIHALDEWGDQALNKCEGMWAFALYDEKTKTLTLSRDPFGEKPLYMYEPEPGEIYFGSEVKLLSSLANVKFKPNLNHISRFLVNGYKSLYKVRETFFHSVKQLDSASAMSVNSNGGVKNWKYWNPRFVELSDISFEEAVLEAKNRLIKSVDSRMRSDVPIAFHLSGGIDSNSLVGIAKHVLDYDTPTFTIMNKDKRYEEQTLIEDSIRKFSIQNTPLYCSKDNFIENLKEAVCYHDAPVITISFYLHWLLQREIAAQGYHVTVSGAGADEIFSGYYDHHLMYLYDVKHDAKLFDDSVAKWTKHIKPIVRNPFLNDHNNFINSPFGREHIYLNNQKYSSYLTSYWSEPFREEFYTVSLLKNRMLNEMNHETMPVILNNHDLNSMYFSIENRSPFLDKSLFEFAQCIPAKLMVKNGRAKAVLREAMKGLVPDSILNMYRKVGFNASFFEIASQDFEKTRAYLLSDSLIFELVKKDCIEDMMNQKSLLNSDSKFLFSFLSSKIFLETFGA